MLCTLAPPEHLVRAHLDPDAASTLQEEAAFDTLRHTVDMLGEGDEAAELIMESYKGVRGAAASWRAAGSRASSHGAAKGGRSTSDELCNDLR